MEPYRGLIELVCIVIVSGIVGREKVYYLVCIDPHREAGVGGTY